MKFRATPREKERIEKLAKALGISMSKLILVAVLEAPPASVTRLDPETERQFAEIGNNINQITTSFATTTQAKLSIGFKSTITPLTTTLQKFHYLT